MVGNRLDHAKDLFCNIGAIVWYLYRIVNSYRILNLRIDCTWRTNFTGAQMGHPMPAWVCTATSITPEKFCSHWVYCSNFCARADLFLRRWESYFDFKAFTISTTASAWLAHCWNNASSKATSARTKRAFSIACCCIDELLSVSWLQVIAFLSYCCWLRCDDDIGEGCDFTASICLIQDWISSGRV